MTTNTIEKYVEEFTNKWNALGLDNAEMVCQCAPFSGRECDCLSPREKYIEWLRNTLTAVVKEAEKRGYAEGKAYWEPAEVHKDVWRQEGYELAKKHFKQIREEAGREVVNEVNAWAENAEVDIDEELNDPTSDFIAHDAYESKLEAFHYGHNEALKNLRAFIKTIGIKL